MIIQLGAPDLLLIFLRFGATIHPDNSSSSSIETILDRLQEYQADHLYPFTLVACLKFILRATPAISIPFMCDDKELDIKRSIYRIRRLHNEKGWNAVPERYKFLINDGLIPESRCGLAPPELKHLSRCVIRGRLLENYKLPYGIQELHVSEEMRQYLDLQVD